MARIFSNAFYARVIQQPLWVSTIIFSLLAFPNGLVATYLFLVPVIGISPNEAVLYTLLAVGLGALAWRDLVAYAVLTEITHVQGVLVERSWDAITNQENDNEESVYQNLLSADSRRSVLADEQPRLQAQTYPELLQMLQEIEDAYPIRRAMRKWAGSKITSEGGFQTAGSLYNTVWVQRVKHYRRMYLECGASLAAIEVEMNRANINHSIRKDPEDYALRLTALLKRKEALEAEQNRIVNNKNQENWRLSQELDLEAALAESALKDFVKRRNDACGAARKRRIRLKTLHQ